MSAAVPRTSLPRSRMFQMPGALLAKRRVQLVLLSLVILLVAVLATGLIATVNLYRSAEDRYVRVALPLSTLTRDVLFRMTEEETGVRGYMITTNRESLSSYFEGRRALAADLAQIGKLTAGRPKLDARMRVVRRQAESLRGFYDRLIVFVADGELGQKQARLEVLDGERRAARLRAAAMAMQTDIDDFIAQTRRAQESTYDASLATLATAGFLALAIAFTLLFRVPERLRRAYAEQEQGAQASRALEHVSEAVFLVDDEERILYWNPAAEQLFAVATDAALGQPVRGIVVDYNELVEAADHGDPFVPVIIDSAERWLAPVVNEFEGGSVVAVRDATAGYALERARADFVATASHELRTPLTAVYGGATTLLARGDDLTPTQRTRLLQMIADESGHLTRIVDQLLVSAQLDRGTLRVDESECDVAALCTNVVNGARVRAPQGIAVAVQMPSAVAPIRCDEALLRQVLINLVDNAIKYSVGGGTVLVRLRDETAAVHVDVVDKGLGIPAADQERIFEKFYRLDAEMTRGVGGSGLGLYISREIVAQLGGTLSVRSQPGRGSTFTVSLPRRA
jgi:signal transduction histidine kinase